MTRLLLFIVGCTACLGLAAYMATGGRWFAAAIFAIAALAFPVIDIFGKT